MIARVWRGWTSREDSDPYLAYLTATGMADSRATPGNRGAFVLRRDDGDRVAFTTITVWESLDAVEGFAGSEPEKAVFYPEDEHFLVDREWSVAHHEIAYTSPAL